MVLSNCDNTFRLGRIPLRHLVYRVHSLPASMRPLVWDFGQLKPEVEQLYTFQIVHRFVSNIYVVIYIYTILGGISTRSANSAHALFKVIVDFNTVRSLPRCNPLALSRI